MFKRNRIPKESELAKELRLMFVDFLKKNTNWKVSDIARVTGISDNTLYHLQHGRRKCVRDETTLALASFLLKEKNMHKLIEMSPPAIQESLRNCYYTMSEKSVFSPEEFLTDYNNYIVYKLAANTRGVLRGEIRELLGGIGVEILKTLEDRKLVKQDDFGCYHAVNKDFSLPESTAKKHIARLLDFTNYDSKHIKKTIFQSLSESVSPQVYNEIYRIQKQAVIQIKKILEMDPTTVEHRTVPLLFINVVDTMEMHNNDLPAYSPTEEELKEEEPKEEAPKEEDTSN